MFLTPHAPHAPYTPAPRHAGTLAGLKQVSTTATAPCPLLAPSHTVIITQCTTAFPPLSERPRRDDNTAVVVLCPQPIDPAFNLPTALQELLPGACDASHRAPFAGIHDDGQWFRLQLQRQLKRESSCRTKSPASASSRSSHRQPQDTARS